MDNQQNILIILRLIPVLGQEDTYLTYHSLHVETRPNMTLYCCALTNNRVVNNNVGPAFTI